MAKEKHWLAVGYADQQTQTKGNKVWALQSPPEYISPGSGLL
jgi:hypothetical protein